MMIPFLERKFGLSISCGIQFMPVGRTLKHHERCLCAQNNSRNVMLKRQTEKLETGFGLDVSSGNGGDR